jgi:hypothetical protein
LYNDKGRDSGSLHGLRIDIAEVGPALTVKADVSFLVDTVFFYFDDSLVCREGIEHSTSTKTMTTRLVMPIHQLHLRENTT